MSILSDRVVTHVNQKQTVFTNAEGQEHDRSKTLGASEAFTCLRKLYYSKTDAPKSEGFVDHRGYFERGHTVEAWLVDQIRAVLEPSEELVFAGKDQVTLTPDSLSATPDGLYIKHSADEAPLEVVTEFKSLDPRSNLDEPKSQHITQVQLQMELLRLCTSHRPSKAVLVYVDASDFTHQREHPVEYNPEVLQTALARSKRVFESQDAMSLPAEGVYSDECRYCAWRQPCLGDTLSALPRDERADLDPEAEEALYEKLKRALPGLTMISIAHRPAGARFHDRVLRVEDGRLIAIGRH
jgi:CRISPR/Cas system-associated exonuclease Cas4 (RecB family)